MVFVRVTLVVAAAIVTGELRYNQSKEASYPRFVVAMQHVGDIGMSGGKEERSPGWCLCM